MPKKHLTTKDKQLTNLDESAYNSFMQDLEEMAMTDVIEKFNPIQIGLNNFKVTFRKANSDEVRTMTCNFFAGLTEEEEEEALYRITKHENKDLIAVYDLDAGRWKSFYQSRVISWEII
jgi:UV DNA damage repair endonuclease